HVDRKEMQFLYSSDDLFYFMDMETFEQIPLQKETIADSIHLIKENMTATVLFFEGSIIGIELPTFVELKVIETEPGFKGDTASGGTKPAKLETGAVIQVPLFIETGDVLKIDTRVSEYISRV
ncbi:MAG TPA: elongation factor P, partial [Thermoanaerobacterales bacterium]|nr:elongation factor P [Thermoanaerobacterales bacterium]